MFNTSKRTDFFAVGPRSSLMEIRHGSMRFSVSSLLTAASSLLTLLFPMSLSMAEGKRSVDRSMHSDNDGRGVAGADGVTKGGRFMVGSLA